MASQQGFGSVFRLQECLGACKLAVRNNLLCTAWFRMFWTEEGFGDSRSRLSAEPVLKRLLHWYHYNRSQPVLNHQGNSEPQHSDSIPTDFWYAFHCNARGLRSRCSKTKQLSGCTAVPNNLLLPAKVPLPCNCPPSTSQPALPPGPPPPSVLHPPHSLSFLNAQPYRPPRTLLESSLPPFCAWVKCGMRLSFSRGPLFSFRRKKSARTPSNTTTRTSASASACKRKHKCKWEAGSASAEDEARV